MILPDIDLLIHAHDSESSRYDEARHWRDSALAGTEGIGLACPVVLGFIRIATLRGILSNPMSPQDACSRIDEWPSLAHVHLVVPAEGHFDRLRGLLESLGSAGNLTTDAHLAALAIERGYTLCSTDNDFGRFPGLSWRNPLATKTARQT